MIPWGGNTHPVSKVRLTANLAALHREINAKFPVLAEQLLYLQEICNRGEFARTVEKAGIDPKTARDLVSFALKQRRLRNKEAALVALAQRRIAEAQRKASASRPPKKAKAQTQLDMH
jgi:hypothetical protein